MLASVTPVARSMSPRRCVNGKSPVTSVFGRSSSPRSLGTARSRAADPRLVKQAERDLGTPLEWVAVTHFNTEHPHVHLVVRGPAQRRRGAHASALICSARPSASCREGVYSSTRAADRAGRDRSGGAGGKRSAGTRRLTAPSSGCFQTAGIRDFTIQTAPVSADVRQQHVSSRLAALQTMGLAEPVGPQLMACSTGFPDSAPGHAEGQ